ncbi:MAG: hypothetical protein EOP49_02545 [Sphingobacteriales bacterium]|nr:MAG: hypothetical protein EOP49_02545 [Sphingobacteriales bacterium]
MRYLTFIPALMIAGCTIGTTEDNSRTSRSSTTANETADTVNQRNSRESQDDFQRIEKRLIAGKRAFRAKLLVFGKYEWEGPANALLQIVREDKNVAVVSDSISVERAELDTKDFNGDGISDLLVYFSSGARANAFYHLYVSEQQNQKYSKVEGFEELSNPYLDSNGIVQTSSLYSDKIGTGYFEVGPDNQLRRLTGDFESTVGAPDDGTEGRTYEEALQRKSGK